MHSLRLWVYCYPKTKPSISWGKTRTCTTSKVSSKHIKDSLKQTVRPRKWTLWRLLGWWLFAHPFGKICSSQISSFPQGWKEKKYLKSPPRLVSFWGPANFLFRCGVSFRLTTNHGIYQSLTLSENQPSNNSKQTQRPDLGSYHHKLVLLLPIYDYHHPFT